MASIDSLRCLNRERRREWSRVIHAPTRFWSAIRSVGRAVEKIDNSSGTVVGYVYRTTTNATLVQGNPLMAAYAVGRLGLRFFETTSNSTIVPMKTLPAGYRVRACPTDHIIHEGGWPLWQQQEAAYFDGFDVHCVSLKRPTSIRKLALTRDPKPRRPETRHYVFTRQPAECMLKEVDI